MSKICQKINCNREVITRGKYCEEHKTKTKKPIQVRIREFEEEENRIQINREKEILEKEKIDEDRYIRQIQQEDYEQAMKMDSERLDKIEFENILTESKKNYYIELRNRFDSEILDNSFLSIRIQLPNGSKINKKFNNKTTLNILRNYIELYFYENNIDIKNYDLIYNVPDNMFVLEDNDSCITEIIDEKCFALYLHNLEA